MPTANRRHDRPVPRPGATAFRWTVARPLRAVPAALVLALVLLACSGSEGRHAAAPAAPRAAETAPPSAGPRSPAAAAAAGTTVASPGRMAAARQEAAPSLQEYAVPRGSAPHDVAPAPDGTVWYTAQRTGELGRLDPATGATHHIKLGAGSAPHGVIVGPDGAAWVTDGGLNAIVRVDPGTEEVRLFPLPLGRHGANLNTAAFDGRGVLWFTGQAGVYGRLDPATGTMEVFDAPRGPGPYGIAATPAGDIYYASLAGSYIARVDLDSGAATVIEPPTRNQGARRVWSDSQGRIWVSEWNAGQLGLYDPATGAWREWRLPGARPQAYAVYVDDQDMVWLSDFGANALVRFDPATEAFAVFPLPSSPANVRQILGRPGEVWGAESGVDKLIVVRTR
jgi:virginiamycin B lyase